MAWLRSRIERSTGVTTWAIEWREGGREGVVRSRSLGPVTEKEAEFQLAAERAGRGGLRRGAPAVTTPKKAVDAFLKHLKVSGRRQGTVALDLRCRYRPVQEHQRYLWARCR